MPGLAFVVLRIIRHPQQLPSGNFPKKVYKSWCRTTRSRERENEKESGLGILLLLGLRVGSQGLGAHSVLVNLKQ